MSDILNVEEAGEYLKLGRSTVYRLSREGVIPHTRIGKSLRFKKDVLDAWLRNTSMPIRDQTAAKQSN
jgi:excisionase family DNA binding protein